MFCDKAHSAQAMVARRASQDMTGVPEGLKVFPSQEVQRHHNHGSLTISLPAYHDLSSRKSRGERDRLPGDSSSRQRSSTGCYTHIRNMRLGRAPITLAGQGNRRVVR